jgi:transposase-like protein
VWEWHKAEGDTATIDAELHQWTTDSLSGVLCIDELYDKEFCLLVATDPLADLTVGFQLLEKTDADATKVAEFMDYLTSIGAKPEVVITDESKLYPAALRESGWGDVLHQLCNFHFLRLVVTDIVASVRAYVQTMPKDPKRKRGRPPKLGRPRSQHDKERKKIQDARFLFTKKALSEEEADRLNGMLGEHSALHVPRDFAVQVYAVFDAKDRSSADLARQAILTDERFRADPNLAKSVARLEDNDRFDKLLLHLEYENLERTSNHVERDNRRFRKRQKAHYRLRLEVTIRNALNLKMEAERGMKAGHQAPKLQPRTAT